MNDDVLIDAVWKALNDGLHRYGDGDIYWVTEDEGREIARAAIEAAKPIIDTAIAAERAAILTLVEEVAANIRISQHSSWHYSGRDQSTIAFRCQFRSAVGESDAPHSPLSPLS
jgi:hypothetical protein